MTEPNATDSSGADPLTQAMTDPLLDTVLELVPAGGPRRSEDRPRPPRPADLPAVSIGRPRLVRVEDLTDPEGIAASARLAGDSERVFVVRLAFSLRPRRQETTISWAQFIVRLLPDEDGCQPLAVDLYPLRVERERQETRRLRLQPSLSFQALSVPVASLGEISAEQTYPAVDPIVVATGLEEDTPCWNFDAVDGSPLAGSRLLYAVAAAPRGLRRFAVDISLTADVEHRGFRFRARPRRSSRRREAAAMPVVLWP